MGNDCSGKGSLLLMRRTGAVLAVLSVACVLNSALIGILFWSRSEPSAVKPLVDGSSVREAGALVDLDAQEYGHFDGGSLSVSLPSLLARSHDYDGKSVFVAGFLCRGVRSDALFLSESECRGGAIPNAAYVEFPHDGRFDSVRSGYVMLEARVMAVSDPYALALWQVRMVVPLDAASPTLDASREH